MPTYCTLQDAFGISSFKQQQKPPKETKESKEPEPPKEEVLKNVCPNCNSCLSQNNEFQQSVVNTALRPLPRWVPQYNNINPWDPFNRYFSGREDFGNVRENFGNLGVSEAEKLIQLIMYLLIALFLLQLFEFLVSASSD